MANLSDLQKAVKEILNCSSKRCIICSSPYNDTGTPATRICYIPKKESHYNHWYFCDEHDFMSKQSERNLREFKEHFKKWYNIQYPPKELEFEDLPQANSIRILKKYFNI